MKGQPLLLAIVFCFVALSMKSFQGSSHNSGHRGRGGHRGLPEDQGRGQEDRLGLVEGLREVQRQQR